jgi:hypothetical protein
MKALLSETFLMANTFAAYGFRQYSGTGSSPTYEQVSMAISSSNTGPIFFGDPVMQAASTTGVGTGLITQAYGPVALTVSGIVVTNGVAVATFTAVTTGVPTSPNAWAPPIGSTLVLTGTSFATGGGLNGAFTVTASTTTTVTFQVTGAYSSTLTGPGTATIYVPVAGVFQGCKYLSVAQKRTQWLNYWPGSDANTAASVTAYVVNDPHANFIVQTANSNTTATAVGVANIGQNVGFSFSPSGITTTNGNTANGLSTFFADQFTIGSTSQLPFRIVGLANYTPDGSFPLSSVNGNDFTTAFNNVIVTFNNSMLNQLAGV